MENLEKVENYLSGKLSVEERLKYENDFAQKQELRELQEKFIVAKEAIVSANIKAVVNSVHKKYINEQINLVETTDILPLKPKVKPSIFSNYLRVAASLFIIASAFCFYQYISISPQSVLADATIDYNPPMFRGNINQLQNIRALFKGQNYAAVIGEIEKETTIDNEMLFLKAMSEFNLKNYDKTLADFATIIQRNKESQKPSYIHEIEYYEALAKIGTGQYDEAITKLKKLQENKQNPYSKLVSDWDIFKLKVLRSK